MSTIAPDRPDTLTAEEAGLLQALDPDNSSTCMVEGCERPAAFRFACVRCGTGNVMCAPCSLGAIAEFLGRAALHLPDGCDVCELTFCMHRWRECIRVTPIAGAGT